MLAGANEHLMLARKATQQGPDRPESPPAQTRKTPDVRLEHMLCELDLVLLSIRKLSQQVPSALASLKRALNEDPNITGPPRGDRGADP